MPVWDGLKIIGTDDVELDISSTPDDNNHIRIEFEDGSYYEDFTPEDAMIIAKKLISLAESKIK